MVLAWTLTVAGFIIIFVEVDGWVSESISENPHPLIGCITTGCLKFLFELWFFECIITCISEIVLAFIQPFMAMMRPLPNAPNRYIFNWAHMLVGYSAHILASKLYSLVTSLMPPGLSYAIFISPSNLHFSGGWNGWGWVTLWNLLDLNGTHLLLCRRPYFAYGLLFWMLIFQQLLS